MSGRAAGLGPALSPEPTRPQVNTMTTKLSLNRPDHRERERPAFALRGGHPRNPEASPNLKPNKESKTKKESVDAVPAW
jgi:hypothetical protein